MGKKAILFLPILPYLFIFIASIFPPLDPDLGWHLKYGEYFYTHKKPLFTNIYSTSMPNFYWANPSWATDIVTYTAFRYFSFAGLSLLSAAVVTLTFFVISKTYKLKFLEQAIFFPLLFLLEHPVNSISFRGQQLSLLCIAILLFLLNYSEKKIYGKFSLPLFIPILFFIWANLHGQFLLGLGIFAVYIFGISLSVFLETKKLPLKPLALWAIIFAFSTAATLITPFGFSIYKETVGYIGNPYLKDVIEYLPFDMFSFEWKKLFMAGLFTVFGGFSFLLMGKFTKNVPNMLVSFTLFTLSLLVRRFAWPFYYTLPAFSKAYVGFYKKESKETKIAGTIIFTIAILISILLNNPTYVLTQFSWQRYCESLNACSQKSADFLKNTPVEKPLYTNYNWGGWLIWNYPEIKPSTDGRMHMWEVHGKSGFRADYELEQNLTDIHASDYKSAYVSVHKPIFKRLLELSHEGKWRELYRDEKASIFIRLVPYSSVTIQ